jgi:hypothetical protein
MPSARSSKIEFLGTLQSRSVATNSSRIDSRLPGMKGKYSPSTQMEKKGWGITKLYNEYFHEPASQLAKLHAKLDDLTLKAYGFSSTDDLLEVLLALNLELAEKEKQGEGPIVGPWAPDNPPNATMKLS